VHASEQTGPVDRAVPLGIDVQSPAGSLPLHLRATAAGFPAHDGYSVADLAKVATDGVSHCALQSGARHQDFRRGGTRRTAPNAGRSRSPTSRRSCASPGSAS
jgi:hypothetical protein